VIVLSMRLRLLAFLLALPLAAAPLEPELRRIQEVESLTGTHARYRQFIGGVEILDRDIVVETDREGRVRSVRGERLRAAALPQPMIDEQAARRIAPLARIDRVDRVALQGEGELRGAWRVIGRSNPLEPYAVFVDAKSGAILKSIPLFANAPARVFHPNPVTSLNAPGLQDQDNSAAAVPEAGYVAVDLPELNASGPLAGPNVTIVELQPPAKTVTDGSQPLIFDRSASGFEEVMAYYHLDRAQRYLQSLGYTGARRIINRPIEVDAHAASGADNSFYIADLAGGGNLFFGEGGVDDAEDADILLHEYAHAIQDDVSGGAFFSTSGSQAAALGEGFGDYWAFSYGYASSIQSGRDPYCVGDWDARCGGAPSEGCGYSAGADCLRRVDSTKTMDQYIFSEQRGTEHRNGEIWSSALRRFFIDIVQQRGVDEGRTIADRIIVESHFGLASSPTFRLLATRMLEVDRVLYGGAHQAAICSSMILGKILASDECGGGRRGDLTLFQSSDRDRAIPDLDPAGITSSRFISSSRPIDRIYVQLRVAHPYRGDLRITLTAPDGRSVILDAPGADSSPDISATYGLDAEPVESLDLFRGMSAAGTWTLRIADERGRDAGRLLSWGLMIRFEGDQQLVARPASAGDAIRIPVVAKAPGAEGTTFVSDARVFNEGLSVARGLAVYTPSGAGGFERFAAMRFEVEPGQTLALDDIVGSFFGTFGSGSLELQGDVATLVVTSRTYNSLPDRTFGQFIGPIRESGTTSLNRPPLHLPQLQANAAFRTNVGLNNISGETSTVRVEIFDASGAPIEARDELLGPWGHAQFGIHGGRSIDLARAEVRVVGGNGSVVAYASVVDNVSGDSIYIPALGTPAGRVQRVAVVANANGGGNTQWRSDVCLVNPWAEERAVALTYFGSDGDIRTTSVALPPRASRMLADVVGATFGASNARGQLEIGPSDLLVTSRTWTPGGAGTYGQFIGAVPPDEALRSGQAHSIQIENSAAYRTNVGIAEVGGAPVTARVRLFDGGGVERFSHTAAIPANGQIQFGLAALGAPDLSNARVSFEVIDGAGAILGYASVVDNRSGDPIYVPAQ
jgi:subtilisin-like proprotein convertase family protein